MDDPSAKHASKHDSYDSPGEYTSGEQRSCNSDSSLPSALRIILKRLEAHASDDAELRSALGELGRWLTRIADAPGSPLSEDSSNKADKPPPLPTVERPLVIGGQRTEVRVRDDGIPFEPPIARPEPPPAFAPPASPQPIDFDLVVRRARLKADCCRWAIDRRRKLADGVDFDLEIKPTDVDLANRLRALPDCFGWPLSPYSQLPEDRVLGDAAGCYDTLADAAALAARLAGPENFGEEFRENSYALLAEACSALRVILNDCDIDKDLDQDHAFLWLRERTYEDRVYVARHMKLSDPADPSVWPERQDAIRRIECDLESRLADAKEVKNLFGKVAYAGRRWADFHEDERAERAARLVESVERLIELGIRPSDPKLRDALLPIADDLPDSVEASPRFCEVLRYIDEFIARAEAEPREPERELPPTHEIQQVRSLLAGKVAVMIGGQCRAKSREALERALGLSELRWVTTRKHESVGNFEADVRRADVDLVLLAIRWSSHSFEEVKSICDRWDKPFVRLPRGYGANQVASEILRQASRDLKQAIA